LEILEGAQNRRAQRIALRLLQGLERVEVTSPDIDWAIRQLIRLNLSQGVDAMDCLIASVSHRLGVPLYTHNLKHFTPLLGHLAQKPY
jgi:predicted nucleic acid-binding protein